METTASSPSKWSGAALLLGAAFLLCCCLVSPAAAQDLVRWRSISAGEEEAAATGRPILFFFTADWCLPCDVLKQSVFSDARVAELIHRQYVPVEVVDRIHEWGVNLREVDLAQLRFGVSGFPTLVVARPKSGPGVSTEGAIGRAGSIAFLESGVAKLEAAEREIAASARGRRSPPRG